jgi:hypothetical protein
MASTSDLAQRIKDEEVGEVAQPMCAMGGLWIGRGPGETIAGFALSKPTKPVNLKHFKAHAMDEQQSFWLSFL